MLIVHTHFHRRRTGVSTHVEAMVRNQPDSVIWGGHVLDPSLPRIGWSDIVRRAKTETVVLHAHRNHEMLRALALQRLRANIRTVFTRHSDVEPGALTKKLLSLANAKVVLSQHYAHLVSRQAVVIGHGVDTDKFKPRADRSAAFAALKLPGTHAIGVVGRIRPDKGQADFLTAVGPLQQEFGHWAGLLVGDVKAGDRRWIEQHLRSAQTQLRPSTPDIDTVYQGLSIVVQPSHRESFGLVALEAMACGACLVASDLPALRELVSDNVTGFSFAVGDVVALRTLLGRLMGDPQLRARLSTAGRERVSRDFSAKTEAARLVDLYRSL